MNVTAPRLAGTDPLEALAIRIHAAVNARRRARELADLVWDDALARGAQGYAASMVAGDYFSSCSIVRTLETPADRARAAGARMRAVGENLSLSAVNHDADTIVDGWMAGDASRATLLAPNWTLGGIGVHDGERRIVVHALGQAPAIVWHSTELGGTPVTSHQRTVNVRGPAIAAVAAWVDNEFAVEAAVAADGTATLVVTLTSARAPWHVGLTRPSDEPRSRIGYQDGWVEVSDAGYGWEHSLDDRGKVEILSHRLAVVTRTRLHAVFVGDARTAWVAMVGGVVTGRGEPRPFTLRYDVDAGSGLHEIAVGEPLDGRTMRALDRFHLDADAGVLRRAPEDHA
jgi:hypothetical protein